MREAVLLVAVASLGACLHGSTPKPEPLPAFDGFELGDEFGSKVGSRAPYAHPCDDDPLDSEHTLRAMVYAGRPCHGQTFPDGTSVVFLVDNAGSGGPIRAFGWMGGTYYAQKIALPVNLGDPTANAFTPYGLPAVTFDLEGLHVARYRNGVRVLSNLNDRIIGFAFGELPDDPSSERWRVFDQIYNKYVASDAQTPPAPAAVPLPPADSPPP